MKGEVLSLDESLLMGVLTSAALMVSQLRGLRAVLWPLRTAMVVESWRWFLGDNDDTTVPLSHHTRCETAGGRT
jgi:hypothetical protein